MRVPGCRADWPWRANAGSPGRLIRVVPTGPGRCSTRWWTPESPGELGVEPPLAALGVGALDGHLEVLGTIANDRIVARNAVDELRAASRLHVGDRVRLGRNLKPRYVHSRPATSIATHGDGDKWVVRLDEPVGWFTDAGIRLRAIRFDPA